jgi:hypothetical protein
MLLILASCCDADQHPWQSGKTETLWRQRYGNCDYGMFLLLPAGTVAHGTLPPAPNHGFVVRLPDVGSTSEIDIAKEERFIWINAEYNESDDASRKGTTAFYRDVFIEGKHGTLTKQSIRLSSLPALRFKLTYETEHGTVIEELILAQRGSIVYEVGLKSKKKSYQEDVTRLDQFLSGFRLSRLPKGECSNR